LSGDEKTCYTSIMLLRSSLLLSGILMAATPAAAHPHVFVAAKAEVIYDGKGNVLGINHVWTFDETYSAFATMGFPKTADGSFAPDKLAELAKVNVESLVDFGYFTEAKASGRKVAFASPQNYRLEHHNNALTMFLTLPLKQPVVGKTFTLEVGDPSYFVAFSFDEAKDAVVLAEAPQGCTVSIRRPKQGDLTNYTRLSDQMFQALTNKSEVSDVFANRATIACP
jgi:ABC-type uncharacterized transport system substrate-binding protein